MTPIQQAIITIGISAATGFLTAWFRVRAEFRKELDTRLLEKKWDTYTKFAEMVMAMLKAHKASNTKKLAQQSNALYDFTAALWLVGSDDVVRAITKWQREARAGGEGAPNFDVVFLLGDALVAMRSDLGYDNSGVKSEDLLATIITDLDKHLPRLKT